MNVLEKFTDADVISKVLNGEKAMYEIIVRRYNPYLYKIGRSYNYSHDDTQDLMQDTYIDAYKSLDKYEGRSNFKTWISRIMLNNCFRKKEKSSFKKEVMEEFNEHSTPLFAAAENKTATIVHSRELGTIIEQALDNIPLDYKMVFTLREMNQMSVAETSELLQISEANVKVRLNRAKEMLRQHIEKSYTATELYEFNLVYCNAMVDRVMNIIDKL
ncbi:MAG TPA: sigma-70 family RNA polymerase sigma factor [Saprospiraceae bacterium]|jgi:RNA polymerase sigma factor (sigma-70 family)|nr:sigma-70 family RNA polymerase sigma factor [Saprospiraceae bacterium]MCC6687456.1 sigma-70 family RNA polymerase sigma factor [Saprospiraceae bacterium]HMV22861.1 sigma-70 family RNA polymerase sigma factor [Saprospiraceae bacterium]HMW74373.1 sigma-70 family RNA polymerase sigma factor [Saprospiraceae bacterium]HMX83566.1 sigma-70 family RNA polymerase sigma factor [Saprospiraceae bacterium]